MVGKHNTEDLFKRVGELNWEITYLEKKGFGEYEIGDIFNLAACSRQEFESVTLKKKSTGKVVDLPYFLCIKPTWFVRNDALYVVFISGNKPSELERVVMWFDCFNSEQPEFEFVIAPLIDDQAVTNNQAYSAESQTKDGAPVQSVVLALRSGGGSGERGGGIGH